MVMAEPPIVGAPPSLDWRNNSGNFVTPVRNQGGCGSCWAFATTAALESSVLRAENTPGVDLNLSEQVLISCGSSGGNDAGSCSGGYISYASDYIRNTGLPLETCYPYTGGDGSCGSACSSYQTSTYQIVSWGYVTTTSPTVSAIRDALVSYGPLVTTMDVYDDFYSYSSGVYTHTTGDYAGGACRPHCRLQRRRPVLYREEQLGCGLGGVGVFQDRLLRARHRRELRRLHPPLHGIRLQLFSFPEQSVPEPAGRFRQCYRHDAERLCLDGRKQRRMDHGYLGGERDGERDGELFSNAEHGR